MIQDLKVGLNRAGKGLQSLFWSRRAQKAKLMVLGRSVSDGLLAKLVIYFLLSVVAYLYLQPILYMISTMLKTLADMYDPTVRWIPRQATFENIAKAFEGLQYPKALLVTSTIALTCSIMQVIVCAMTGYALARLSVPFRALFVALIILTFVIPPQVIIIPLYVIFSKLGLLNTLFVFLVPAMLGQGVKAALFILIFMQFFRSQPPSLEEAAKLDGASTFRLFAGIMLPLARSACLVVFLFSFIWYWNLYYEPSMFLTKGFTPLSIRLEMLEEILNPTLLGNTRTIVNPITEGTKMAAAFMIILPPILVFMVLQKWFVSGIERTGIVE
jgi:multiple sugar transport system permease protein